MKTMDRLRVALSFGGILTNENIEVILQHFREKELNYLDDFLCLGDVSNQIGFIDEGIFRAYAIGYDGEEVTKYFFRQNQFLVDLESYYGMTPTDCALQAMVKSKVFTIHRNDWQKLSEEVPQFFIFTKSLTEAGLLNKIKDNDFLSFGTAKRQYQEFMKRYPDLALRIPQQFIASYLKITPQSLSRIRKELAKQE